MNLIERLSGHRMLRDLPRAELEWLAAHGEFRVYETGAHVVTRLAPVIDMVILLTGGIAVHFGHGTGRIHKLESHADEISGLLPFSRMDTAMGDAVTIGPTEIVAIHRDCFPELIRDCPVITARLVHAMIDRARSAAATNWQDEKMVSLGRLAAGFAHQLNNPASAAVRSAKQVGAALTAVGEAALALGRTHLDEAQLGTVEALMHFCLHRSSSACLGGLARADREEQIVDWLASRDLDTGPASTLASCDVQVAALDDLHSALPRGAIEPALRWIAAASSAQALAGDVEQASGRIYDLIGGMMRFTSMDRAAVAHPLEVAEGLADTATVLGERASARSITVKLDIAPDLPKVIAHAVDLNQVWSNLLENAIDAAPEHGHVMIRASAAPHAVVVRVIDDGPGIAPEVQARMFDPFFTTKDVGRGIGFGLDIVRRIVRMYEGDIAVDTRPGCTEFRVRLPAAAISPH